MKRAILIIIDSMGIGDAPDAAAYGDEGYNTLETISNFGLKVPNMEKMGLFNIEGINYRKGVDNPTGAYGRLIELSKGKDTTIGHWEISGVVSESPMPTYPNGFPSEVIEEFERLTGRKVLCNKPYSGTDVIRDYGKEHMETGDLIVYTSADSVFQIAAHESLVSVDKLYEYCEIARGILKGKHGVGRVIARPFEGEPGNFRRTERRHDFSLEPTGKTMLDIIKAEGMDVLSVGKIVDIFAGRGITDFVRTGNNDEGLMRTIEWMERDFHGLMFVNLVDTDMKYGHRNDVPGYTGAVDNIDDKLTQIISKLRDDDVLIISADHGCDPRGPSTDHSRECVPVLFYGKNVKPKDLGRVEGFNSIAATVLNYLGTKERLAGEVLF